MACILEMLFLVGSGRLQKGGSPNILMLEWIQDNFVFHFCN